MEDRMCVCAWGAEREEGERQVARVKEHDPTVRLAGDEEVVGFELWELAVKVYESGARGRGGELVRVLAEPVVHLPRTQQHELKR